MKALLSFMDTEDREQALRYYERLFELAGEDGEEGLLDDFGSPLRQVLHLEKRYRERQESGMPLFDEEEFPAGEAAEPEQPAEEPADAFSGEDAPSAEENGGGEEPAETGEIAEAADDAEEVPPPQESLPGEETVPAAAEAEGETEEGETFAPYDELPSQVLSDAAGEMLAEIDFGAEEEPIPAETREEELPRAEAEAESAGEKTSGARVAAALLLSPLMVLLAAAGVLLTFALSAIPLALCALFGAASLYLALYAVTSMPYLPDMLLVLGVAVGLLAATVFFLWGGLTLLSGGIGKTIRLIATLFGRVLGKGGK
ncbi:MAG: hypothetical protein SPE74_08095 [Oscillospiraceae bacterium]|nr:hypothetical protein [Oscillospiraceae bacterium]